MTKWPVHGTIDGPIVMIGFGSIGRGTLPLLERHFKFDRSRLVVIDPDDSSREILDRHGVRFIHQAVTRDRYRHLLEPLLTSGGQAFCVNLSVDTSSLDIMRLCRDVGALYIDTVVEPWPGFYFDRSAGPEARTNNALRATVREEKARHPGGATAVSCCGANPGMVSWFVKQALVDLARDLGRKLPTPAADDQPAWAKMMHELGVKGIHIAERDTQRSRNPKPMNVFVNTWSVEGFLSEGMQPAELGWGTHEKWLPENGRLETIGSKAGAYLLQPGANTRVRSWCPTPGPQYGFLGCCSTATRRMPTGTARSSPSTRRATLRRTRMPRACRSRPPCSRAWSGRWKTPPLGSSRRTRWTSIGAWKFSVPTSGPSPATTPIGRH